MNHLDHCEQLTDQFYRQLLEQCWLQLDERLDQLAHDIGDEKRRTRHYLTMQEVHFKAERVAASVALQNQQNYIRFRGSLALRKAGAGGHESNPDNPDNLNNSTSQRDSLTLNRAIRAATSDQQQPLWQLHQRLSLLRGGQRCDEHSSPLAPGTICLAFQDAVCDVDIDPRIRLILYEVFAGLLEQRIAEFYREINHYFVEAGVLANLRPPSTEPSRQYPPATVAEKTDDASAQWEQLLDQAHTLLLTEVRWPAPIHNALDLPGILPTHSYLSACTLLQRQIAAHVDFREDKLIDPDSSKRQYFKYLVAHMGRQRAGLNRELLLWVELLTRMFQSICDDEELPVALRCMASFLYAPCIKLALTDRTFFLSANHPARRFLDLLLRQGSLWLSSHADDPSVLSTVRGLVCTLACDLSDDGPDFSRTVQELTDYLGMLEQRAQQTERREVQSQAGMESLDRARAQAQQQVAEALQQHNVQQGLRERINGPCTDYLTFILLHHGEGRHWNQAQHLLKGIALSVRGQLPREQLIQFQRGQQRLYKAVGKGLAETGYEGMLAQDLLSSLRQAQQQLVEKLAVHQPSPAPDQVNADSEPTGDNLDQLHIGQWYRFEDRPQNSAIQLKLAWHSDKCARALFVDASGTRRRLEYADRLARALSSGQLQIAQLPAEQHSQDVLHTVLHELRLNSLRQRFQKRPTSTGKSQQKIC